DRGQELSAKKTPARRTPAHAQAKKAAKGRARVAPPVGGLTGGEAPAAAPAPRQETPFERFVLDFVRAPGRRAEQPEDGDYEATFDPELAKRLRRSHARLVFDAERAILPRGGLFAAPGSRLGLALLDLGRGHGHVSRTHMAEAPGVDVAVLAKE